MLFGKKESKIIFPRIATLLRKRYGLTISEPLLSVALLNGKLLTRIKEETISEEFIFLELVRIAIKNDIKFGTYDLKIENPTIMLRKHPLLGFKYRLKKRKYLMKTFPQQEIIRNGVIVAVLGYLIIRLIEHVISLVWGL